MRIIDGHVHLVQTIGGYSSRGELRPAGKGNAQYANGDVLHLFPPELGKTGVTPEAIIRFLDRYGVEKAVLLQGSYLGYQNLYTYSAMQKYPERFTGAAIIDPFLRKREEVMEYLFGELKYRILKLEVSDGTGLMSFHHTFALDGELMQPIYEYMNRLGCTIVFDIGRPGDSSWQIDALRRIFLQYPDMKFVVCHLMGVGHDQSSLLERTMEKLALPNVWFDLAGVNFYSRPDSYPCPIAREHVHIARDIAGAEKLIWGSDIPQAAARDDYANMIGFVMEDTRLTAEEKNLIFSKNAEKVYFGVS